MILLYPKKIKMRKWMFHIWYDLTYQSINDFSQRRMESFKKWETRKTSWARCSGIWQTDVDTRRHEESDLSLWPLELQLWFVVNCLAITRDSCKYEIENLITNFKQYFNKIFKNPLKLHISSFFNALHPSLFSLKHRISFSKMWQMLMVVFFF